MSNEIADLHPLFRGVARKILDEVGDLIFPSTVKSASTWRSLAEQAALLKAGKTAVAFGWHQTGLGFDVACYTPSGAYIKQGDDWRYRIFGKTAQRHGCIWGGVWNKPDWDHCELHPGISIADYRNWIRTH